MKLSKSLLAVIAVTSVLTSCKTDQEKKAEMVTNDYIQTVDSIIKKSPDEAITNWSNIEQFYEKKTSEVNVEIDKLEEIHQYDAKLDSVAARYEAFKNSIMQQKLKLQSSNK